MDTMKDFGELLAMVGLIIFAIFLFNPEKPAQMVAKLVKAYHAEMATPQPEGKE